MAHMASHTPTGMSDVQRAVDLALSKPAQLGKVRLICIDGPAGSGKTTFAQRLAEMAKAPVAHMDDLYEGWAGAFAPELPARIDAWLLTPLRHGLPASHPRFDWLINAYAEWVTYPRADLFILEGVGSANQSIRAVANCIVWMECDPAIRLDRVLKRDGEQIRPQMLQFQRDEEQHFLRDRTKESADLIASGEEGSVEASVTDFTA
jgi:uridine kinase